MDRFCGRAPTSGTEHDILFGLPPSDEFASPAQPLPSRFQLLLGDWTTLSFSINFLNPVPGKPLLGVISTMEFAHNTKDRRGAVHNVIWDQEANKVIAVSRQAVLMTAFPMYDAEDNAKI
ncbi:hypothetical protein M427DRAFT_359045 [Gonapodya prolifera JEL478]|uniref:Thioesterase domain-containing protein n=1 Tax=Gonapodya prolifera (strain JEL478) TaxID=1344416 RepID=A0A139AAP4_GONPJ|nr:hypothetical protein M427DRAFT_359045 [Gonapodya prolifera JEL478]|eukprot:KXS13876.1 hypothetical protein M427DRAFT_359045 [Gonapodya prolifera JEL478]